MSDAHDRVPLATGQRAATPPSRESASPVRRRTTRHALATLPLVMLLAVGCGGGSSEVEDELTINPPEASVQVGEGVQLSARNAQGAPNWTSSDESIASVVSTGFTTGIRAGRATITATDSRGSASATVTVLRPAALALSASSLAFTAQSGAGNPASQTVQITDGGDVRVTNIAAQVTFADGQPSGWLTATLAGNAAPTQLTVSAATGTLPAGTYSATVTVTAGLAVNSPQSIPVTFTVTPPPSIVVAAQTVDFTAIQNGANPAPRTVNVTNGGAGTLTGLAATIAFQAGQPQGWLAASLSATTATATTPSVLTLTATTGALPQGTYTATVSVAASNATNSPQRITVTFLVASGPTIALSRTTVPFGVTQNQSTLPDPETVTITNAGGGTLSGLAATISYPAGQPQNWLTATLNQTTATATLTLRPNTTSLPLGNFTATVNVTSPVASNSPRTITVTYAVQTPPQIVLGTNAVALEALRQGGVSQSISVSVQRSGGGIITGLSRTITPPTATFLTATLQSTTTPTTISLQANAGTLAPGTYTATVSISAPNTTNSPQNINVTFNVLVSYAQDVFPQINPFCNGCHFSGGNPPVLNTAGTFRSNQVNVQTTRRVGFPLATTHPFRIVPGSAATSYLIDQMNKATGAFGMPDNSTVVPLALRNLIGLWINQGARAN